MLGIQLWYSQKIQNCRAIWFWLFSYPFGPFRLTGEMNPVPATTENKRGHIDLFLIKIILSLG